MTLGVFLTLSSILYSINLVPELRVSASGTSSIAASSNGDLVSQIGDIATGTTEAGILTSASDGATLHSRIPVRVNISAIGVDVSVTTPSSTDIEVLDSALLSGAVHYPGSGLAGESANMLIFGHSSYLPYVRNKSYQAFNALGTLQKGDRVIVETATDRYTYTVTHVRHETASDVEVWFDTAVPTLTLATCDVFGKKQDRWIVTATLSSMESNR